MKRININSSKAGFTIIEMIIVLAIATVILLVVVPSGAKAMDNSRLANAISSIKAIQTAGVGWANDNGGVYTGITFAKLAQGYLPAQFSATATNPWAGNYTVAVNASDATMFDISLTSVPSAAASKLTNVMTKLSEAAPGYVGSTQTWTTTMH